MQLRNRKIAHAFVLLILLLATGCGNSNENSPNAEVVAETEVGTGGQLISIASDNVAAAGYDVSTLGMSVQFNNGARYEYYQVPAELWEAFIAAQPHPWSQVGYPRLVQGRFAYKRVG
jgi:hypothetical protein